MEYSTNQYPFGKKPKPVRCLDIETGKTVKEFNSISEAAKDIGKGSARVGIMRVCDGLSQTAYGYKWEYIN